MTLLMGEYEGCEDIREQILRDWSGVTEQDLEKYEILAAGYWEEGYEGTGWVLYRRIEDGKLCEEQASHCSCHGLEWEGEPAGTASTEVTIAYLLSDHFNFRVDGPRYGPSEADRLAIRALVESLASGEKNQ